MKKNKVRNAFFAELKKVPIVQVACEKTGISRNSVYRWKREDKNFSKTMDEALIEGEDLVNDMSESQLLTLIKEKNFSAIRFWLNHRNPRFKEKVEVTSKFEDSEELTPSQTAVVRRALQLAEILPLNKNNYDSKKNDPSRSSRSNDKG
jgi:predicted DNA binding protein